MERDARDAGWYRDESGNLRYWNGTSWAGHSLVQMPVTQSASRPVRPATQPPPWRVPVMTLGWIAAIFTLGMLLTGVKAAGADCGAVFSPRTAEASCAKALHSRTTAASVTAAAALLGFAASSRAATRIAESRCRRGNAVLA